ncbi:MMPL family transporter [Nocardia cyriacigeorgica]|uniref:RND superfamily putative drug exporter n=5 Tax=Nocardiaceae TaxID=85025 RepID=A0A366CUX5_9NOCA|nr:MULTISPECIES: MMPL family transporter [Nocardia]RBO79919.1 RND superfamily putative drug exporter [Nocardia puris]MBF6187030.1 MMPL family transporter [Nocardia farcinica]MBF6325327.1 MMPL family transporter [Nocardia cyriacigeorgica]MBF6388033.1 MMPL family transporter [Nocardia farcinica]MBF6497428.1 MMPL family transporter [Nocardia cyriacigeorgica]
MNQQRITVTERSRQKPLPPGSPGLLYRWGVLMARRRRAVLAIWALLLAVCAVAYPLLENRLGAMDFGVEGSESTGVDRLVAQHFPQFGAEQAVIVLRSSALTADDSDFRAAVTHTVTAAKEVPGVVDVIGPYDGPPGSQISADGHVAIALVGIGGDMAERARVARDLQGAIATTGDDSVEVGLTGYSAVQNAATELQNADLTRAEAIGIPVALILLVLALGALVAAAVPIGVAIAGLLTTVGVLFGLTTVTVFDSLTVAMATMVGLGVGIDYAMFIVSRFREELAHPVVADHAAIAAAVGRSLATAGKTILVSGLVVMISLCALIIIQAPIFRGIAIGVATAVISMLIVAVTLLPALLAVLGPAVNRGALPARWRPADSVTDLPGASPGRWARWAYLVMRRPVLFGTAAVAVFVIAAFPVFGIRYGLDMGTSALDDTPTGRATTALTTNFPAGALSPVEIIATGPGDTPLSGDAPERVNRFLTEIAGDERIATVLPTQLNDGRVLAMAIPSVAFDSMEATNLIRDLRTAAADAAGVEVRIGGSTAEFVDLSDEMTTKLPLVVALVLTASLIFLIAAFRSIALPVKAIAMNLLATGAALGITVAVFQWGLGENLLDFTSPGFVQVYLPTVVFALLFGLSMDYEVFLIRRMREYWDATGNNQHAVAAGLTHTARPITAAAAIMIAIFASFLTADILELKQLGLALAVAVFLDAALIRLVLVPALMRLLGDWNWWLPTRHRIRSDTSAPETSAAAD